MSQMQPTSTTVVADPSVHTELSPEAYPDKRLRARRPVHISLDIFLDAEPPLIVNARTEIMSSCGATLRLRNCDADTYERFSVGQTVTLRPSFGSDVDATINALWIRPSETETNDGDDSDSRFFMGVCLGNASWAGDADE